MGRLEKEKLLAINDLQDLALKADVQFEKERDSKALEFDMKIYLNEKDSSIADYNTQIEKNKKNAAYDV